MSDPNIHRWAEEIAMAITKLKTKEGLYVRLGSAQTDEILHQAAGIINARHSPAVAERGDPNTVEISGFIMDLPSN